MWADTEYIAATLEGSITKYYVMSTAILVPKGAMATDDYEIPSVWLIPVLKYIVIIIRTCLAGYSPDTGDLMIIGVTGVRVPATGQCRHNKTIPCRYQYGPVQHTIA